MVHLIEHGDLGTLPSPDLSKAYPREHLRHPSAMACLATTLERSGGYKVLRRVDIETVPMPDRPEPGHRIAVFLDFETTGLDPKSDAIIQCACVPFTYDRSGAIVAVHDPLDQLRDPGRPIPPEVTRLTGIDDAMVRGKSIDKDALNRVLSAAALVIAHNAAFDRVFAERFDTRFATLPWACSIADLPWREEDVTTTKLEWLAMKAGLFYEAHRALADCLAAVEILRRPLPVSGRLAMAELLRSARRESCRVVADKAPFERKELLKARGYRWRVKPGGSNMAWSVDVGADGVDAEVRFLREEVYETPADPTVIAMTAYTRYSARV